MKVAVNIEFTDDELRKYAEDVGRRMGLNFIHDTIKHIGDPRLAGLLQQIATSAAVVLTNKSAHGKQQEEQPRIDAEFEMSKCSRVEADRQFDEGWVCCNCSTHNGVHRPRCRHCDHERCDIVVPPVPEPNAPSGTA